MRADATLMRGSFPSSCFLLHRTPPPPNPNPSFISTPPPCVPAATDDHLLLAASETDRRQPTSTPLSRVSLTAKRRQPCWPDFFGCGVRFPATSRIAFVFWCDQDHEQSSCQRRYTTGTPHLHLPLPSDLICDSLHSRFLARSCCWRRHSRILALYPRSAQP
ncbi:hypothetical protein LXL04_026587 [Taraxacum kok-saghyz]